MCVSTEFLSSYCGPRALAAAIGVGDGATGQLRAEAGAGRDAWRVRVWPGGPQPSWSTITVPMRASVFRRAFARARACEHIVFWGGVQPRFPPARTNRPLLIALAAAIA